MRRAVFPALLVVLLWLSAAAAGGGAREIVLFDQLRGSWLGTLKDDAPYVVLEERDGWRRVRLEGWIMNAGAAAPPAGAPADAPRQASVRGVLAPAIGDGGAPGGGVVVLLVQESEALDREHRLTGEECRARLDGKDRDLEALRAEVNRALNSSENFREASARSDQAKTRLARAQRERWELVQDCRARALRIFEGSVLQRAISDAVGRFDLEGIAPGRYRVVAFETSGDSPRSWSYAFLIDGIGLRVLDPVTDRSPLPADWGLR